MAVTLDGDGNVVWVSDYIGSKPRKVPDYRFFDPETNSLRDIWYGDTWPTPVNKEGFSYQDYFLEELENMRKKINLDDIMLTSEDIAAGIVQDHIEYFLGSYGVDKHLVSPLNCLPIGTVFKIGRQNQDGIMDNDSYIILGFNVLIGNNRVSITTNKGLAESYNKDNHKAFYESFQYICYNSDKGKVMAFPRILTHNFSKNHSSYYMGVLRNLRYKVTGNLSGKIFGYPTVKNATIGKIVKLEDLINKNSTRLQSNTYAALIYDEGTNKTYTYCLRDLEIILPSIKGYNPPKDKTFRPNRVVYIKGQPTMKYTIVDIVRNKASKRISNTINRQLDVAVLSNGKKVWLKNLKIV